MVGDLFVESLDLVWGIHRLGFYDQRIGPVFGLEEFSDLLGS